MTMTFSDKAIRANVSRILIINVKMLGFLTNFCDFCDN